MTLDKELIELTEETKRKVLKISEEIGGNIVVGDEYQLDMVKKNLDMVIDLSEVIGDYSTTDKAEEIEKKLRENDITYFVRENRNEKVDNDKIGKSSANVYSKIISLIPFSEATDIVPSRKMEKIWRSLMNISREMMITVKNEHNNAINSNKQLEFMSIIEEIIKTPNLKPSKHPIDFVDISIHMILWSINEVYNSVPILSKGLHQNLKAHIVELDSAYRNIEEDIEELFPDSMDNETDIYSNLKKLRAKKEILGENFNPGIGFVGNRVILYDSIEAEKANLIKVTRTTNKNEILRTLKAHTSGTIEGLLRQNKLDTDLSRESTWKNLEDEICLIETVEIPSTINMIGDTAFYRMNCYYENVSGYKRSVIRIIKLNKADTKFIAINNCDRDRMKVSEQLINKTQSSFCDKVACINEEEVIAAYKNALGFINGVGTIWDINWEEDEKAEDSLESDEIKISPDILNSVSTFNDREHNSINVMTEKGSLGYKLAEKYDKADKEIKSLKTDAVEHYRLLLLKLVNSTYSSLIVQQLRDNKIAITTLVNAELNSLENSKAGKAASLKELNTINIIKHLKTLLEVDLNDDEKQLIENLFITNIIKEEVDELDKALSKVYKAIRDKLNLKILIESTDNEILQLYRRKYFSDRYSTKLDTNRLTQFYYKEEKPILIVGTKLNMVTNNEVNNLTCQNLSSFFMNKYIVNKINIRTTGNINLTVNEIDTESAIEISAISGYRKFKPLEALIGIDELHINCFNIDENDNEAIRFIADLTVMSVQRLGFSKNSKELTNELCEWIDYYNMGNSLQDFAKDVLFRYPDSITRYMGEHLVNEEKEKYEGAYQALGVREANKLKRSLQGK